MATVQMSMVLPINLALTLDKEKGDVSNSVAMRCLIQYLARTPGTISGIIKSENANGKSEKIEQ